MTKFFGYFFRNPLFNICANGLHKVCTMSTQLVHTFGTVVFFRCYGFEIFYLRICNFLNVILRSNKKYHYSNKLSKDEKDQRKDQTSHARSHVSGSTLDYMG